MIVPQFVHYCTGTLQVGGHAIGFLSVTTKVDADLLNVCYQLEPFHGLKCPSDEDEVHSAYTEGKS